MQTQAQAIKGHGRDINDALGNLGPFAEDASVAVDILNRQEGALRRLVSNTGVVFGALTERDDQLRGLIENSNRVFATTAARDRELQEAFVALPTFARESRQTLDRLDEFAADTNPLVTQLRPAARELSPTLQRPGGARARPQRAVPRPRQADHRLEDRLPGGGADPARPAAAARADRPGAAPADPDPRVPRRLQGRAELLLRQHRGRDPGLRPRHAPALPAHDEPAQPREPRRLSAPPRLQPPEPLPAAGRLPAAVDRNLQVYENRHCGRAAPHDRHRRRRWRMPTAVPTVDPAVPDLPRAGPDRRSRPSCRPRSRASRRTLIDRINQFAFPLAGRGPGAAVREAGQVHHRRRDDGLPARQGQVAPYPRQR